MRIVLVEDNKMLASGICKSLSDTGHSVEHFTNGEAADGFLRQEGSDLAIVDINLQGLDGMELTKRLRSRGQSFPVLMLTARGETLDRVRGLDAGADDYLVKPFAIEELEARIRALSRRRANLAAINESIGLLNFDRAARRIYLNEVELTLSRRELSLFETLLDRQSRFVSKSDLADTLYGIGSEVDINAIESTISRLRRQLKDSGVVIRTARGIGYMLEVTSG